MAAQLTQRWKESVWGPAAELVANPPEDEQLAPAPVRKPRQFQRRLPPDAMDQAMADYATGMSSAAVGAKYDVDAKTVITNLRARGIEPREAKRQTVITGPKLEEAIQLRKYGWTYKQIGARFGVSRVAATNALKQAGPA